jgi:type VI secretion system secreted protein Hcp
MSNIFMKIKGIEGDSSATGYPAWIRLSSVSVKNSRNVNMKIGKMSDREGNTPKFDEIEITKQLDQASNGLFQKSCQDKAIPEVEIHVCTTDSALSPYFKLLLTDVIIAEHQTHAMADVKPVESLRLSFSKIQRSFIAYDKNKQPQAPNTISYDLATAQMV